MIRLRRIISEPSFMKSHTSGDAAISASTISSKSAPFAASRVRSNLHHCADGRDISSATYSTIAILPEFSRR